MVDVSSAVNTLGSRARTTRRGEHRTEVTEATEGDSDGGRKFRSEHLGVTCENHAKRRASHRGHRGHRVDSDSGRKFRSEHLGIRRENPRRRKHRTEATEGDWDGGRKFPPQ
jgi:hypothetical protein